MKNESIPDLLKKEIRTTRDIGSTEFNNGLLKAYELLSPYIMEWKPIESAPKDGKVFIGAVFKDGQIYQLDACNLFPHFRPPYTVVDKEFGGDIVLTHCCEMPKPPKRSEDE